MPSASTTATKSLARPAPCCQPKWTLQVRRSNRYASSYNAHRLHSTIGWVVFGGLGIAAVITLYLTPVLYLLLARFSKTRAAETDRLQDELAAARIVADIV
jgi:hypothetical protein